MALAVKTAVRVNQMILMLFTVGASLFDGSRSFVVSSRRGYFLRRTRPTRVVTPPRETRRAVPRLGASAGETRRVAERRSRPSTRAGAHAPADRRSFPRFSNLDRVSRTFLDR